jgi:hypothetical protein
VTWALTTTAKAARRKVTRAVMSFILTWLVCRLDVETMVFQDCQAGDEDDGA